MSKLNVDAAKINASDRSAPEQRAERLTSAFRGAAGIRALGLSRERPMRSRRRYTIPLDRSHLKPPGSPDASGRSYWHLPSSPTPPRRPECRLPGSLQRLPAHAYAPVGAVARFPCNPAASKSITFHRRCSTTCPSGKLCGWRTPQQSFAKRQEIRDRLHA